MNRTIDARVFYLLPDERDRRRLERLLEEEICEAFILDKPDIVKPLLLQMEKSILIIDSETFPDRDELDHYAEQIVSDCGDRLLRLFIIGSGRRTSGREKIIWIDRRVSDDDENIICIVDDLDLWGMRNYIRFGYQNSRIAFFRMKFGNHWRTGVIHDISASGMSCSFDRHIDIDVTDKSSSIELCIKDKIFRLAGSFLLRRTFKNSNMFVLVFSTGRGKGHIEQLNSIIFKLTRDKILDKIERLAES